MTGTLINVGTVLAGGAIGLSVGSRLPATLRQTLMQAVGLTTLVVGLQRALPADNVVLLLASLALGGLAGELLRIEAALDRVGALLSKARFLLAGPLRGGSAGAEEPAPVTRGFVTASLLFCVGPMTILGSFEDGLSGAYQTLAVKATLDGIGATLLASTLGWGVLLASGTILFYQGSLTLGAGLLRGLLTEGMIAAMTAAGGVLILGIGLNILGLTRIRVGNLLPALIVAPAIEGVLARGG